ncbi:PROBABLE CONSERVED INTEGRAL MEMBRANE ALANINE AND LEUCINE RICH PROTEIN [[Actinomadura] parvosata subsp. kistnae]|uniref:DUF3159 domain-containing protein n=1 Tax=[Actinomadura] parvosata subsp. kistnae TaxID=1909395 RepID=A0A1U9ZQJ2_9ACTN|nr:DUF3159 domain-containing protein [Nonomuraea sp. ATCC 55076]AQZ60215.1 hypothetical protein BKM31_00630 [Nonomuraea sp. ATCC 55076]SPL91303.1 PROBABLE CONSERVED INTEGRAL MEMBRANE ALANINE AND LEUCINE RICH PROTEIN [Actinomadura parvosata subsp. kistnae]
MSAEAEEVAHDTVEAAVRAQLAKALGGVRGIIEAAVPTIAFTLSWISSEDLKLSLIISISLSVVLLVVRVIQKSTPQFVINSLIGIAIGAFFASRSGDAKDYFLPGILYNAGYAVAMLLSIATRWPVVGFLIGSVTGDPTAWHKDPGIVRLCTRLTWLLMLPCAVRVAVQGPVYLFGGGDEAVAALGFAKIVMGWPLQVAALGAMLWLLGRGRTPIKPPVAPA